MSTTIAPEQATPQFRNDGSLDSASKRIEGLLALDDPSEAPERPTEPQPEQRPTKRAAKKKDATPAPAAEQAPTAPEAEAAAEAPESEPVEEPEATATNEEPEAATQPRTFTVKIDGKDETVTEDELIRGYSRQKDYTTKTMALAADRKKVEQERATERQQHLTTIETYKGALTELQQVLEALQPKEPNWAQLRAQLPLEDYNARRAEWSEAHERIAATKAEIARVDAEEAEHAKVGYRTYVEEQQAKLIDADPDFGDPTAAPALQKSLVDFAVSRGFAPEEVAQVADHRLVLLLRDAMRYRDAQAKTPALKNKIEQVIPTAAPGGSRANDRAPSKSDKAFQRLQRSGRLEDAAAAIEGLI